MKATIHYFYIFVPVGMTLTTPELSATCLAQVLVTADQCRPASLQPWDIEEEVWSFSSPDGSCHWCSDCSPTLWILSLLLSLSLILLRECMWQSTPVFWPHLFNHMHNFPQTQTKQATYVSTPGGYSHVKAYGDVPPKWVTFSAKILRHGSHFGQKNP